MKVLQVHNRYRFRSGEDVMFDSTLDILKQKGHEVLLFGQNSRDLQSGFIGKLKAFSRGIYSYSAVRQMSNLIKKELPDIIHIHNVYPLISPFILSVFGSSGVPVVMTIHNCRLTCPIGIHFHAGRICKKCKGGREYFCLIKNCRHNILESLAYSLRSAIARKNNLFLNNITIYIAVSNFVSRELVEAGFPQNRIEVVPNMTSLPDLCTYHNSGDYVVYVGSLSPGKGLETLLAAARLLPQLKFLIAGDGPIRKELDDTAPGNVTFVGWFNPSQLSNLYHKARLAVVPSTLLEAFGLVVTEAMSNGLPVVASRIAGPSEIVDEGITGLLFQPGNPTDLAEKINSLWEDPELCRQMGQAGREKVIREYSEDVYYKRLMSMYTKAISMNSQRFKGIAKS